MGISDGTWEPQWTLGREGVERSVLSSSGRERVQEASKFVINLIRVRNEEGSIGTTFPIRKKADVYMVMKTQKPI
jgi:hypothetical protein